MKDKEQLSMALFKAVSAIGDVMVNIEFSKDNKAMMKANRVRNWLLSISDKIDSDDSDLSK